jgi:hypothetical protein
MRPYPAVASRAPRSLLAPTVVAPERRSARAHSGAANSAKTPLGAPRRAAPASLHALRGSGLVLARRIVLLARHGQLRACPPFPAARAGGAVRTADHA